MGGREEGRRGKGRNIRVRVASFPGERERAKQKQRNGVVYQVRPSLTLAFLEMVER